MRLNELCLTLALAALTACGAGSTQSSKDMNEKRTLVKFETTAGNFTVALYDETSKHRDNFIKLVKEEFYDSTLFHRVIRNFMIQAGDPESKTASDTASLGNGEVGYTVSAEFMPVKYFHRRGALAAARQGDEVNPAKASSGCQFYIVTGRTFTQDQLLNLEGQLNEQRKGAIFNELVHREAKEIDKLRRAGDQARLLRLQDSLESRAHRQLKKEGYFKFTPAQLQAYTTVGGAPHLDGSYTVFGEVVKGMDTIEKIESSRTNKADRPLTDVRILKATLIE